MEPLIIVGVIAVVAVVAVLGYLSAQKRRQAMMALAARLGLRFDPQKNRDLAERYRFLDKLRAGSNRYAFNTLSGGYESQDVTAFDYHYETHSTDSKGHRQTHHHYFSCFLLHLPRSFPELVIAPGGVLLEGRPGVWVRRHRLRIARILPQVLRAVRGQEVRL